MTHGYLRKGTRLFASPALAGDSLELGVLRPGEPIWQEAAFGAVKVLGRREGALHVETLTAVESSCASDRSLSGPFRLRGYVRPDALEAARPTPCPAPDSAPTLSELQTIGISHADPCDPDPRRQLGTSDIQLAAGAALTWPDGSDAGASTEITTFRCRRAHAKDDGARLCHALGGIGESPVLCFARAQADVLIRR